ncbi:hypothetical protein ACJIZ3_021099 [Penstemon smallii]|uniref:DYW domain-containing protein n=1 Tax=Penstemon smallii TaxID=265156 RepID=A0ABD3SL53_9LAMI
MYTRRGGLVTYNFLRPILKLCISRTPDFLYSINAPGSIRNLAIATERSDVYNTFDGNVAENHSRYNNLNQKDRFYGRDSGGLEQNFDGERAINLPRYLALMKACGENEALEAAKSVHAHLLTSMGNYIDVRTYNKILEMYSKCGSMEHALAVFNQMPKCNITSWDIMIFWLAKNGLGEDSVELFEEFKKSGLKPDGRMFIGVFSACGALCDTIEGMLHFKSMVEDYGIVPSMEHYVSIVDMLGSAGCLDEALEFIEMMPIEPGSRIHGNLELGDRCTELVEHLDASRLNEQSRKGLIPKNASGLEKEKVKKKLYRSISHPDNERIYTLVKGLKEQMKDVGYVPETKFEEALLAHSERLAAAQGFLTSAARAPIRIISNFRVCGDCHNAFKIISKIVGRQIIARDSGRFHHFENGSCSCNDYW